MAVTVLRVNDRKISRNTTSDLFFPICGLYLLILTYINHAKLSLTEIKWIIVCHD